MIDVKTIIPVLVLCALIPTMGSRNVNANRVRKYFSKLTIENIHLGYARKSHTVCEDIDECSTGNPCNSLLCVNTPGSYTCLCPAGRIAKLKNGIMKENLHIYFNMKVII